MAITDSNVRFLIFFFPLIMIFAACMDLFTMRISNWISIVLAMGFLPIALLDGLPFWSLAPNSIALHYACGLLILLVTFVLFAFGKIGGGDAKLAASSAIWIGWEGLLDYLLVASLLGGVLGLFFLAARTVALPIFLLNQPWIARLHEPRGPLPFGVALGVGAIIVYPQTSMWLSAMGS